MCVLANGCDRERDEQGRSPCFMRCQEEAAPPTVRWTRPTSPPHVRLDIPGEPLSDDLKSLLGLLLPGAVVRGAMVKDGTLVIQYLDGTRITEATYMLSSMRIY